MTLYPMQKTTFLFVLLTFSLVLGAVEARAESDEESQLSEYFGLTVQTGVGTFITTEDPVWPVLATVVGPDLLFGIALREASFSTEIEFEFLLGQALFLGQRPNAQVVIPSLLITPRLVFVYWFTPRLGLGWGASWSQVFADGYAPDIYYVSSIANIRYTFVVEWQTLQFLLSPLLETGLQWNHFRNKDGTNGWGIGLPWVLSVRACFPVDY